MWQICLHRRADEGGGEGLAQVLLHLQPLQQEGGQQHVVREGGWDLLQVLLRTKLRTKRCRVWYRSGNFANQLKISKSSKYAAISKLCVLTKNLWNDISKYEPSLAFKIMFASRTCVVKSWPRMQSLKFSGHLFLQQNFRIILSKRAVSRWVLWEIWSFPPSGWNKLLFFYAALKRGTQF